MSDTEEAWLRFQNLIKLAGSSSESALTTGNLREADFDELQMLAAYLGARLPLKAHGLLENGFPEDAYSQKSLGERLTRIIAVSKKYQGTGTDGSGSELLPTFCLEPKDKERVFKLCKDMRKIVFASTDFDDPHKKRLLNRIAAIEKQVHSPRGLFDVILGGVSDVGETLGKFGKDIKPLSDRMSEIAQITRTGSEEYEQIPAPEELKKLPPPDDPATGGE